LFRYIYLVHAENFGGEPELIFKDRGMVVDIGLWMAVMFGVFYYA